MSKGQCKDCHFWTVWELGEGWCSRYPEGCKKDAGSRCGEFQGRTQEKEEVNSTRPQPDNDPAGTRPQPDFEQLGKEIGQLVNEKNRAYGNAFEKCEKFLKLLWPDGVPVESYLFMLALVRIFDKQVRIATDPDYGGESPFKDIAGYGILGWALSENRMPAQRLGS